MRIYVITGTTRGIGRALAENAVAGQDQVLSLSRAADHDISYWKNVMCDLADTQQVEACLVRLLNMVDLGCASEIILINNAGVLDPMGPIELSSARDIAHHVLVNIAAPALLTSAFVRVTRNAGAKRSVINISSGAARHPYSGWALYCASKAALDMMTLCVAEEQRHRDGSVSICSVYPGKVETAMQETIRQADEALFPARPDFVRAKEDGELFTVDYVARMILDFDRAGRFENGGIYDIRGAIIEGSEIRISPLNDLSP